jgi:putative peptidoglycan lipid II flippase
LRWPTWDKDIRRFFRALGPATVGSAGVDLALFADTIIASFLATGALSALYYADRLQQLPIGVIGIAAGTVLLPEMARRIAGGDDLGARHAQNRTIEFALLLALPCVAAFLIVPELIMRALFARGAFTYSDAEAAGMTLAAYAIGLVPFVLIRSMAATFLARGDTWTPVKASLIGVAVNIAFKIALMGPLAQVGLALATAIGAWINFTLVTWFAWRARLFTVDPTLRNTLIRLLIAAAALAIVLWPAQRLFSGLFANLAFRDELTLVALALVSAVVYFGLVFALLGKRILTAFRTPPPSSPQA